MVNYSSALGKVCGALDNSCKHHGKNKNTQDSKLPIAKDTSLTLTLILSLKTYFIFVLTVFFLIVDAPAQRSLKPMPAEQWFVNYQSYLLQATSVNNTAEAHYQLGQWALKNGLEDEAWEQWILALRLNPHHLVTRKATGYSQQNGDGKWSRPGEVNQSWIAALDADQRGLSLSITIEDDADADFFVEYQWRLRRLNEFIWQITEGQIYIKKIHIQDNTPASSDSTKHRIIIPKGQLRIPVMKGGGALCKNTGRSNWQVISGGRCYVRILAHEIFHGIFGLPDERHGCYCLMQGGLYGISTKDLLLCDATSHRAAKNTPVSCWSLIQQRYPNMKHPNAIKSGQVPEVTILIDNR